MSFTWSSKYRWESSRWLHQIFFISGKFLRLGLILAFFFLTSLSSRMWMGLSTMLKTDTGRRSVWESPLSVAVGKAIKPLKALDITPSTSTHPCDTHTHTFTQSFSRLPNHPFICISWSTGIKCWFHYSFFFPLCVCDLYMYVDILVHLHIPCISFLFYLIFLSGKVTAKRKVLWRLGQQTFVSDFEANFERTL